MKTPDRTVRDEILAHAAANCDQHEIRGEDREKILAWVSRYPTGEDVIDGIMEGVGRGFTEIGSWGGDEAGPMFKLTTAGDKYVEAMLSKGKP